MFQLSLVTGSRLLLTHLHLTRPFIITIACCQYDHVSLCMNAVHACASSSTMGISLVLSTACWHRRCDGSHYEVDGILQCSRYELTCSRQDQTLAIRGTAGLEGKLPQNERRLWQCFTKNARAPTDIAKLRWNARALRDPGPRRG